MDELVLRERKDKASRQTFRSQFRLSIKFMEDKYYVTFACKKNQSIKLQTFVTKTKISGYIRLDAYVVLLYLSRERASSFTTGRPDRKQSSLPRKNSTEKQNIGALLP